jgi:hypothetical protein
MLVVLIGLLSVFVGAGLAFLSIHGRVDYQGLCIAAFFFLSGAILIGKRIVRRTSLEPSIGTKVTPAFALFLAVTSIALLLLRRYFLR